MEALKLGTVTQNAYCLWEGHRLLTKRLFQVLFLFVLLLTTSDQSLAQNASNDEIKAFLNQLFHNRAQLLVHHQQEQLKPFYLQTEKHSKNAMEHEFHRSYYLKKWAEARGVQFVKATGDIRIVRVNNVGDSTRVSLVHSLQLTYQYPNQAEHTMGIGTRHVLNLKKNDGNWYVFKEWYLDPLEENPRLIPTAKQVSELTADQNLHSRKGNKKYNREKAVQYADKYAGLANQAGQNRRYNQKYLDYTYQGGDCTNFTSQVLGDKEEGGGLPMRPDWRYRYNQGGNVAWVRTDSFNSFLIRSGYGKLIAKGTYEQVAKPTPKYPGTALAQLQPGDVIGYEMNGDVDHFSIVTARDIQGYVLVNSHTADRYHVPWDLGWDKRTKFLLFRIGD